MITGVAVVTVVVAPTKALQSQDVTSLRKFQQTPGKYPGPQLFMKEILSYFYFGVPGVCSRGLFLTTNVHETIWWETCNKKVGKKKLTLPGKQKSKPQENCRKLRKDVSFFE